MKKPTLFYVKLLVNTEDSNEGDILKIKEVDEKYIYYYDKFMNWQKLELDLEGIQFIKTHEKDL